MVSPGTTVVSHPVDGHAIGSFAHLQRNESEDIVKTSAVESVLRLDETFFVVESRRLAALATRMKVPLCEVEDLVQEAWLNVIQHREQFTGVDAKRRVSCWLRRVVHGKAVDLLRHLHCFPCDSLALEMIDLIDDAETKHAATTEIREWFYELLEKASLGHSENLLLFRMHFFQGFSIPELAHQFDMKACVVEGRIRRLLRKLRELAE